jgi:hypothetical protein
LNWPWSIRKWVNRSGPISKHSSSKTALSPSSKKLHVLNEAFF